MDGHPGLEIAIKELKAGIDLPKCQQCGCMGETLQQIVKASALLPPGRAPEIQDALPGWAAKMKSIRYSCLGCEHCYAGVAQNAFISAFPETERQFELSCEIKTNASGWPPVVGEYLVLDPAAPVAVTTLASPDFSRQLADQKIPGLAIVGKLETENIGIDKVIKNTIANPNLRYLIVTGSDPKGHLCGQTLLALAENGVDADGRVIGSRGKRPILRNVSQAEIEAFRRQVRLINLIGCDSVDCVREKIAELRRQAPAASLAPASCDCADASCPVAAPETETIAADVVEDTGQPVKLDKAGYFVILPIADRKAIHVEHYGYDNSLLHVLEGTSARSLYLKMIEQGWVSEMSHAAYLGKELARAQLSLNFGIPYSQDAA